MSELNYPYADHPTPGTTQEVVDGVRWLTMPMPGSLSHINLYLLILLTNNTTRGQVAIDSYIYASSNLYSINARASMNLGTTCHVTL